MSEEMKGAKATAERPGCVTAYAILLWVSAGLGLFGALCGLSSFVGDGGGLGGFEIILGGVILVFAAIYVAMGIGLWRMEKWGWALVVVMQGVSLILGLISMALTMLGVISAGGDLALTQPTALCSTLVGALVSGFILYWFIKNRELFNGGTTYETVVGPDGEMQQEPVQKSTSDATMILVVVGGMVMVLVLVCVVVIALLAVMGPQIGNVFSQITFTLENAPAGVVPLIW